MSALPCFRPYAEDPTEDRLRMPRQCLQEERRGSCNLDASVANCKHKALNISNLRSSTDERRDGFDLHRVAS